MSAKPRPWLVPFHGRFVRSDYAEQVRADVDQAPPLTPEQKDLLRVLFKPSPHDERRPPLPTVRTAVASTTCPKEGVRR